MPVCYRELVWRVRRLDLLRRILGDRVMDREGLRRGRMPLLEFLRRKEGSTQKEVADQLHISPASVAVSVRRMEKEGLVRRDVDESDLRRNRVYITPQGRTLIERCNHVFEQMDRQMFRGFSERELEELSEMLERLFDNLAGEEFRDLTPFNTYVLENELQAELEQELRTEEDADD
ncbi:MAG: MarR family transcriptional regulator [Christensenellales bacterium]|uniref:MarR family transcriptional regulator n=1 Tax=Candidatus Avichristensenella intestinipullorum TaxID=2840693 RepID=A0A9D1CJF2_9FIRM|nr:MarR family transcriptional regulator [Christensenellales bacterium]HIQ62584.1 MarR family transcriptional regulator [Candidatus Avichristensenella intestinipullorum]